MQRARAHSMRIARPSQRRSTARQIDIDAQEELKASEVPRAAGCGAE